MRLSWCPQTWYSAWCSLTTTLASLEPASPTLHIHPIPPAKRAPRSTLSQPPTAPTATKAGTHETNKSMCPSKALWLSLSVNSVCQQLLSCVSVCRVQTDCNMSGCWCVYVCLNVYVCYLYVLACIQQPPNSTAWFDLWAGSPYCLGKRVK